MADNVAITPGAGATVAADDVSSVYYQVVKIMLGADGAASVMLDDGQQTLANSLPVGIASNQSYPGAPNFAATQPTCDNTADILLAARAARRSAVFVNIGTITAYLGASGVATSTGLRVQPGESVVLTAVTAIYGITASGTATFSVWEEHD
jgi:hypothetical protein